MRNPSLLIYNMVNGIIDTNLPIPIYDYNSMYKIIQPFVLTKEKYEQGVQSRNESGNNNFEFLPENDSRELLINKLQEEPIKITFIERNSQTPHYPPSQPLIQTQPPDYPPSQPLIQTQPPNNVPNTVCIPNITNTTKQIPIQIHVQPPAYPITSNYNLPNEPATQFVSIHSQTDPLFWCLFISLNGIKEYQYLTGRYTNRIIDEKLKLVNFLKLNDTSIKPFLKKNKITGVSMKMIMSSILSNEPVDFKSVILYCYFYKINITFVYCDKYVYFTVIGNEDERQNEKYMYYIEFSLKTHPAVDKKYKFSILTDEEKIKQSKTYFNIENVEKPLNAMASYKINELTTIAEQLRLLGDKEINNKLKKNDLYKLITEFFKEVL